MAIALKGDLVNRAEKGQPSGKRRNMRYTRAELDAYHLDPVRNASGEIAHYRVVIAGDVLGTIERAPYGHRGWLARIHGTAQPHRSGPGRYATNREKAVIDLLLALNITTT